MHSGVQNISFTVSFVPASRATRALSNNIILLVITPLNLYNSDNQVTYVIACDSKAYRLLH